MRFLFLVLMGLMLLYTFNTAYAQTTVNFEGTGETKTSYSVGTVSLSGISWVLEQALIGTTSGFDRFNGSRALRIRHRTSPPAGRAEMQSDIATGIGTVSFVYAQYTGEPNPPVIQLQYSTNGGSTWTQAGSNIVTSGVNTLTPLSISIGTTVPTRIRFITISGDNSRRANIDDIVISPPSNPVSVSISAQTNVACNGDNTGSLTATATDGTANYDYVWSNGSTTFNTSSTTNAISNLAAGTYTVTITDNNGSTSTVSATVTEPSTVDPGSVTTN